MADKHFDFVVIGGGPAGYVGAIRAAQLGYTVACVERAKLGGVCLNWGCIPSKALLTNAELMEKLNHGEFYGLKISGEVKVEWSKVIGRSRDVASKLNAGIGFLLKKNKIEHFEANAKIVSGKKAGQPCKIEIQDCEVNEEFTPAPAKPGKTRQTITADHIIVATGSVARELPGAPFDHDKIWGAREAMNSKEQPKKLIVVGSGAIGMEFGYFYHCFGTEITVIEMMDRIFPVEDNDVSKAMEKHYKKKPGFNIKTSTITTKVEKTKTGVKVTIAPFKDGKADDSKAETLEADKILVAIGVKGRYDGLFDDSLKLETFKDHIKTDYIPGGAQTDALCDYKTNIEGIYAVGDVIGPPWLAHVASEEAILCVERIAWKAGKIDHEPIPMDYSVIPGCTYCQPQIASVGSTEQALIANGMKKGTDYEVGKYAFASHGKAIAANHTEGFTKIIRGIPHGEILGAHIMGDQATELIGELTLARRLEATTEDLITTVHAHPTMHEAIHEAALASEGKLIHG